MDHDAGASQRDKESWASSEGVRRSMKSNRGRDTLPELRLRSRVHRRGLRYRVDAAPVKGLRRRADMVFGGPRVAVFVDGCFWHGCPIHYTAPVANGQFWAEKVAANVRRDRETDRVLSDAGWHVLRFWEHEDPDYCARVIEETVRSRRAPEKTLPSDGE